MTRARSLNKQRPAVATAPVTVQRIAIVGSRDYPNLEQVRAFVRTLPEGTVVVSGGARGVDTTAVQEARQQKLAVMEFLTDWEQYGPSAGAIRNQQIVNNSDRIVAFWDGQSRGTQITLNFAKDAGKPVTIVKPDDVRFAATVLAKASKPSGITQAAAIQKLVDAAGEAYEMGQTAEAEWLDAIAKELSNERYTAWWAKG